MKNIFVIIGLMFITLPIFADQIYLTDNTVQTVTIKSVNDKNIEFTTSDNEIKKLPREQLEKIIYSSGKEIEFYDKIYMKDGTLLKGRVIKKGSEYIEYNPAGEIPFEKIKVSKITKIIYENGTAESSNGSAITDMIYFKDGKTVKASGIIINKKDVEFNDENNNRQVYGRSMIEKIIYDGKTLYMDDRNSESSAENITELNGTDQGSKSFLEFELGWNGYAGLGLRYDYLLFKNLSLNGAAGLGRWGLRASGALRYYLEYPYGLAFSLGAAYNTGGYGKLKLETQDTSGANIYKENVKIDYKSVPCINGSILYSYQVNGSDRIYVETGYSYALKKKKYNYNTESGRELTPDGEKVLKTNMDVNAPGGVMISVGYAIGF